MISIEKIAEELKPIVSGWIKNFYASTGGFAGSFLAGSGLSGRIAQFAGVGTLIASLLSKTGIGVLTLNADGDYVLTIPATGTTALLAVANVFTAAQTVKSAGGGAIEKPLLIANPNTSAFATTQFEMGDGSTPTSRVRFEAQKNNTGPGGTFYLSIQDLGGSLVEALQIDSLKNIGVNGGSAGASAAGVIVIKNGTAPTSSPADSVQLFAADVSSSSELRVRDEGGTTSTISPHAKDSPAGDEVDAASPLPPIVLRHENIYAGEREWIHVSALARAVQQLTGQQFIFSEKIEKADWDTNQQAQITKRQAEIVLWQELKDTHAALVDEWEKLPEKERDEAKRPAPFDKPKPEPIVYKPMPEWLAKRVNKSTDANDLPATRGGDR